MESREEIKANEVGRLEDVLQPGDPLVQDSGPTRTEHLAWCKTRALEYCDRNDPQQAFSSMTSDLNKHPDTQGHLAIELGMMQLVGGMLSTAAEMRRFIEGFN